MKVYAFEPGVAKRFGDSSRFVEDMTPTIRSDAGDNKVAVVYPIENHPADSRVDIGNENDPVQTLTSRMGTGGGNVPLVIYPIDHHPQDSRERLLNPNSPIQTLPANMQYSPCNVPILLEEKEKRKYRLRRLTPDECCRLQGFPDWWEDGVEGSDSNRYKMWGNGIALPCAVDVLWRIKDFVDNERGEQK